MTCKLEDTSDYAKKSIGPARVDPDATKVEWTSNHTMEPVRSQHGEGRFAWLSWEGTGAIASPLNEI
jgi:hypothetical protein